MRPADSFTLKNTSIQIPSRGLGTFQVDPKVYPEGSVKDSVLQALKLGYRHIDAALGYGWGSVERDIGAAIAESGVAREELFVVTKLYVILLSWNLHSLRATLFKLMSLRRTLAESTWLIPKHEDTIAFTIQKMSKLAWM